MEEEEEEEEEEEIVAYRRCGAGEACTSISIGRCCEEWRSGQAA